MLSVFPRLTSLRVTIPTFPKIITELGRSETKCLREILINCCNTDCLEIDELLTFLKHRPKNFHFYIYFFPANDLSREQGLKLIKLLNGKLKIGLGDICISIGINDKVSNWYLPSGS
uniref:DUF4780 domain-containing protein n=1 Tax=Panagrellus redivivus TaxID=6233 RepID=A0A7E4V1B3_PANRE